MATGGCWVVAPLVPDSGPFIPSVLGFDQCERGTLKNYEVLFEGKSYIVEHIHIVPHAIEFESICDIIFLIYNESQRGFNFPPFEI